MFLYESITQKKTEALFLTIVLSMGINEINLAYKKSIKPVISCLKYLITLRTTKTRLLLPF